MNLFWALEFAKPLVSLEHRLNPVAMVLVRLLNHLHLYSCLILMDYLAIWRREPRVRLYFACEYIFEHL